MAAKIRCPGCGAKNDPAAYRCRICTAVINPGAERPAAEEPTPDPVGVDHFDAGDINRQIRPARERFSSGGGALAARIAAASGGSVSPTGQDAPMVSDDRPATAEPSFDDAPFDPDALFRDMS